MLATLCLLVAAPQGFIDHSFLEAESSTFRRTGPVQTVTDSFSLSSTGSSVQLGGGTFGHQGIELREVEIRGRIRYDAFLRVEALTPFTDCRASTQDSWSACGGGCNWGPHDFANGGNLSISNPLSVGEVWEAHHDLNLPFTVVAAFDTPFSSWSAIAAGPSFTASVSADMSWFSSAPVLVLENYVETTALLRYRSGYRLSETDGRDYCTNLPSSTGSVASITTYGSVGAGSRWLVARTSDVPVGSAGVLLVGSQPDFNAGATANTCIGGSVQRAGGVQVSATGFFDHELNLVGRQPGESLFLQTFFRDPTTGVSASLGHQIDVE